MRGRRWSGARDARGELHAREVRVERFLALATHTRLTLLCSIIGNKTHAQVFNQPTAPVQSQGTFVWLCSRKGLLEIDGLPLILLLIAE